MRYAEYNQQIKHLKMSLDDIVKMLDSKTVRYALLVHDSDIHEDGTPVESHVHVMMDFKGNSWEADSLCKWFNDDPNRIEKPKSKNKRFVFENMCSYLIHETESADGKFKYDPSNVIANFDFMELITNVRNEVKSAPNKKRHPIQDVLEDIMNNKLPYIKLDERLDDMSQLKYKRDIDVAYEIRDRKLARENQRHMNVMYFYGESGSGKTTWAYQMAKNLDYSTFISGSSNDPLEGYMGQECIILDDIRGSDWKINDLIKMLDNNFNSLVKSRYRNKLLNDVKLLILTSTQSVDELYSTLKEHENEPIHQLKRRCKDMIHFTMSSMEMYRYDEIAQVYNLVHTVPNLTTVLYHIAENKDSMLNLVTDIYEGIAEKEMWKDEETSQYGLEE